MKFIIDKNVLRAALSGNNPNTGQFDSTSSILVLLIPKLCHSFIITKEIEREFELIFDEFKNNAQGKLTLNAITAYFNAKKIGKVDNIRSSNQLPKGTNESSIKEEDLPFARLSRLTSATLITYDIPLKEVMGENAKDPNEVLELIGVS